MNFRDTHNEFKIRDCYDAISALRNSLGDTNLMDPFHVRPWFTQPSGYVYIRKDVAAPSYMTFLLLTEKS